MRLVVKERFRLGLRLQLEFEGRSSRAPGPGRRSHTRGAPKNGDDPAGETPECNQDGPGWDYPSHTPGGATGAGLDK